MEENKETTQAPEQPKQLSYEQLRNVAGQLQQQNMQLRKALQDANFSNMFRRLDYLFKVMEYPHMFSDEFVQRCALEIESSITIPESEEKPEEKSEETEVKEE